MNWCLIVNRLSAVLFIEAGCMVPSLAVSLIYRDGDTMAFALSILIVLALAIAAWVVKPRVTNIHSKEGFAIGGLGWLIMTALGALPFLISPGVHSYADAFFEAAAGFSTTGATVFPGLIGLSRALIFWRSSTHWMGGLGFLLLIIALAPSIKANALHMMRVESTGLPVEKFVPNIKSHARILYTIYAAMTAALAVMLALAGMPLFEAICYSMGAVSTGGFDANPAGLSSYNNVGVELLIAVFMLMAGTNLVLYYLLFKGDWRSLFRDEELRLFMCIVVVSTGLITLNIYQEVYATALESAGKALFQVSSIITTAGFSTADYQTWPTFSQGVLLMLMLIGGCAGSTAGGMKVIRWLLLFKVARREVYRILHPRARRSITINGRAVDDEPMFGAMVYFALYLACVLILALVIALDGKDPLTNISAAIACVGNVGPGLGMVGPSGSYAGFSARSKTFLAVGMIIGRLEIYPVLILCIPAFWKKVNI
ncbi:MAG: TrkH family potassium uptake protein [Oscillospiraceae bacterium]|jgi:trk system potassium uptake protein TrkH|nr:TrkH family potassium uptake protein [Oscillospiraceae bacterium]